LLPPFTKDHIGSERVDTDLPPQLRTKEGLARASKDFGGIVPIKNGPSNVILQEVTRLGAGESGAGRIVDEEVVAIGKEKRHWTGFHQVTIKEVFPDGHPNLLPTDKVNHIVSPRYLKARNIGGVSIEEVTGSRIAISRHRSAPDLVHCVPLLSLKMGPCLFHFKGSVAVANDNLTLTKESFPCWTV
jgi:hypothetical protein